MLTHPLVAGLSQQLASLQEGASVNETLEAQLQQLKDREQELLAEATQHEAQLQQLKDREQQLLADVTQHETQLQQLKLIEG